MLLLARYAISLFAAFFFMAIRYAVIFIDDVITPRYYAIATMPPFSATDYCAMPRCHLI